MHVAVPSFEVPFDAVAGYFRGDYFCCLGLLRRFQWQGWENADWRDWIVDAPITCIPCLAEDIRRPQ